jgi:hypothetical protein
VRIIKWGDIIKTDIRLENIVYDQHCNYLSSS